MASTLAQIIKFTRLAIGTEAITKSDKFAELTDDYFRYIREGTLYRVVQ